MWEYCFHVVCCVEQIYCTKGRSISVQRPACLNTMSLPRTLWNTYQTANAASGLLLRRTTFSMWTHEQKRFSICTQPRHLRGHGDSLLASQHLLEQEHRPKQLILRGQVGSQSLNGLSFGRGKKKNFKLTISNTIVVDELVNSKKMILYVWH